MKTGWMIFLMVLLGGCFGPAPKPIANYIIEYEPPVKLEKQTDRYALTVKTFSADGVYADPFMIKRHVPFRREAYPSLRWRISPAEMTSDFIRRDFRSSGLFNAVLSPRDGQWSRFVLTGRIEEFLETLDEKGRRAVLAMTVTLIDRNIAKTDEKIILHKYYRQEVEVQKEGGEALASAMSRALSGISARLIVDTAEAVRKNGR